MRKRVRVRVSERVSGGLHASDCCTFEDVDHSGRNSMYLHNVLVIFLFVESSKS